MLRGGRIVGYVVLTLHEEHKGGLELYMNAGVPYP